MKKITIFLLLLTINSIYSQEFKYSGTNLLEVREDAGTEFKIIAKVSKNENIKIISDEGEYVEIETEKGIKGYVPSKFLLSSRSSDNNSDNNYSFLKIIVVGLILFVSYKVRNLIKLKY